MFQSVIITCKHNYSKIHDIYYSNILNNILKTRVNLNRNKFLTRFIKTHVIDEKLMKRDF